MIEILNLKDKDIDLEVSSIKNIVSNIENTDLPIEYLSQINLLFSNPEIKMAMDKIKAYSSAETINYEKLNDLYYSLNITMESLYEIKESVDVEIFLKEGARLDRDAVYKIYEAKAKEEFPDYDIDKLCALYKSPPKEIPTYYNPDLKITIDSFQFRKKLIAINQMVLNAMDVISVYVGKEGAGKSLKMSQDMWIDYWILKELKLIDYEFKVKDLMFSTLKSLLGALEYKKRFKLHSLDEGNELNRQNWKDPDVSTFFQKLRRERYYKRLYYISLPVLGELIPNITLSRVNFIFEMDMENNVKSGSLKKGMYNFYIIPRTDTIYSPALKKELSAKEIKNKLYEILSDRSYLITMPDGILIKRCLSNGVWGFKEEDYVKELKETGETFSVNKGLNISEYEAFLIYKSNIKMKRIGLKSSDIRYHSVFKVFSRVKSMFEKNPQLAEKYELVYKRKLEEKEQGDDYDDSDNTEEEEVKGTFKSGTIQEEAEEVPDFTSTDATPSFPVEKEEQVVDLDSVQTDAEELFREQKRSYK
jgi:hypothetical protein